MEQMKAVKCRECGNDSYCFECPRLPDGGEEFSHLCSDCIDRRGKGLSDEEKNSIHVSASQKSMQDAFHRFLEDVSRQGFEQLWQMEKKQMKEMSKRDLGQFAFSQGAQFMYAFLNRQAAMQEQAEEKDEKTG